MKMRSHGRRNLFSPWGVRWSNGIRKKFQAPKFFVKLKTFFGPRGGMLKLEVVNLKIARILLFLKKSEKK